MENQEVEYRKCLEDIELYRTKRERIFKEITEIRANLANDDNADVLQKLEQIKRLEALDEEYGAKMHALAIKRNLLEP